MPGCNRGYDNQFIVLSHWNITPQTQSYDIPPVHIILTKGQPVFVFNNPFYVKHLIRELELPIWNLWFDPAGNRNLGAPRHGVNALPLRYHAGCLSQSTSWPLYIHCINIPTDSCHIKNDTFSTCDINDAYITTQTVLSFLLLLIRCNMNMQYSLTRLSNI